MRSVEVLVGQAKHRCSDYVMWKWHIYSIELDRSAGVFSKGFIPKNRRRSRFLIWENETLLLFNWRWTLAILFTEYPICAGFQTLELNFFISYSSSEWINLSEDSFANNIELFSTENPRKNTPARQRALVIIILVWRFKASWSQWLFQDRRCICNQLWYS
jgi:hypothetical protein